MAWVFNDCDIRVGNYSLKANLIPLEIVEFDIIFGMDFLEYHHAIIDCFHKVVVFRSSGLPEITFFREREVLSSCLISAPIAKKLMRKNCQAFLAHVVNTKVKKIEY